MPCRQFGNTESGNGFSRPKTQRFLTTKKTNHTKWNRLVETLALLFWAPFLNTAAAAETFISHSRWPRIGRREDVIQPPPGDPAMMALSRICLSVEFFRLRP
jgi:hypothetical protein